jgi:hypothetical protein
MVLANMLDVYALPSLFSILNIWIYNQPLLSSFSAKSIGFLLLQLSYDIMGARFPNVWHIMHLL